MVYWRHFFAGRRHHCVGRVQQHITVTSTEKFQLLLQLARNFPVVPRVRRA
jgi:hypothetical protein